MDGSLTERVDWCLPAHGRACFDMLPATVVAALTGASVDPPLDLGRLAGRYEHVVIVYFDAFGWKWYERHSEHPLLEHARAHGHVSKLTSQFPSTTAAHMTTIHTGLPVGSHGVYEWFMLLRKANRIIAPLLFSFAGDAIPNTLLDHGVSPSDVFPEGDFYATLRQAGVDPSHCAPVRGCREHTRPVAASPGRRPPGFRDRRRRSRPRRRPRQNRPRLRLHLPPRRRHNDAQARYRRPRGRRADRRNPHRPAQTLLRGPLPAVPSS